MLTRNNIQSIKIEKRGAEVRMYPTYNITMFVKPKKEGAPTYKEMIDLAEHILRESMNLVARKEWYACNADAMAWSGDPDDNPENIGIDKPHEYRVVLDIKNRKDKDGCAE